MTAAAAVPVALLAIAILLVVLVGLTVARRSARRRAERRRRAVAEPLRPVLLELAAGGPEEAGEAAAALLALPPARWAAVEPDLTAMLLKVRGDTHVALVDVLGRRGVLATALAGTRSRHAAERARSAEVLGAAGRRAAVPELVDLLDDADADVRQVAARALGRIGSPEAVGPLLDRVGAERSVPPRILAAAVLRIGVGAHPGLLRALSSPDALKRAVAAEIAGLDGAMSAGPALVERLSGDAVPEVRVRAARALGRLGLPSAVEPLLAATADHQPLPLRMVAARALGDLGAAAAVPRLAELLGQPTHRLAANAAHALAQCGPSGIQALRGAVGGPARMHAREALAAAALRAGEPLPTDDPPPAGPGHAAPVAEPPVSEPVPA